MPIIDDRTSNLDLPLPHVDNNLTADVPRIREALTTLDTLLGSDTATLDTLQEIVTFIQANRGDLDDLLALVEVEEVQTLAAGQTVVDFAVLTGNTGCTVFIEGIRLNSTAWTPDGVIATRITLAASYPSPKTITIVRRQGGV